MAAYRVMLHRDQLVHDPELLALLESNTTCRWIGARRHIIVSIICVHNPLHCFTRLGVPYISQHDL
jgi:hypothetical protein